MVFQAPNCPLPPPNMVIEDAKFVYQPNFEGRPGNFNEEGERFFNVRVPDNIVEDAIAAGWNVKYTKPKDEREPEPYLEVAIGFKYRPPTIVIREDGNETVLTEETCGTVDSLVFDSMDIVLRGRAWKNHREECGIKAWLQTFYGNVQFDDIQRKYARLREDA